MLSLYAGSSAVHLRRFHQAVGILEAAKGVVGLGRSRLKALWWEGQLVMVLLYVRRHGKMLELIDHALNMISLGVETKIAV